MKTMYLLKLVPILLTISCFSHARSGVVDYKCLDVDNNKLLNHQVLLLRTYDRKNGKRVYGAMYFNEQDPIRMGGEFVYAVSYDGAFNYSDLNESERVAFTSGLNVEFSSFIFGWVTASKGSGWIKLPPETVRTRYNPEICLTPIITSSTSFIDDVNSMSAWFTSN